MNGSDPVREMIEERKKQAQNSIIKLNELAQAKIRLQRPVFFVPGWTDEACWCWSVSYKNNVCIKDWLNKIFTNPQEARYINFEKESPNCNSFLDFGEVLKNKIWDEIGKEKEFDIVGHSMGGLDIRAAIAQGVPLLNTYNCLTVATPHWGDNLGGINVWCRNNSIARALLGWMLNKETPSQIKQSQGLDPDYEPIKIINKPENRIAFLERIGKLYQFKGTRDFTVKGSAFMDESGVPAEICSKIQDITIEGADHTGKLGITQDPRTILSIIKIILDLPLDNPHYNYGILIGGIQNLQS